MSNEFGSVAHSVGEASIHRLTEGIKRRVRFPVVFVVVSSLQGHHASLLVEKLPDV